MRKITLRSARAAALAAGLLLSAGAPVLAGLTPINATIYALTSTQHLVSFNTTTPGTIDEDVTITGITAGQTLVGMDFRPATGALVALGYDQATTTVRLYTINLVTGAATAVGAGTATLNLGAESAANVGMDFNPTVDRIRVVSADINANVRLNPNDGTLSSTDTNLAYAPADVNAARNPNVGAVAYSNSYLGATSTTLYDADLDFSTPGGVTVILSIQSPPNSGTLNTINSGVQPPQLLDVDIDVYNDLASGVQTGYTVATYNAGPGIFANLLGIIDFNTATIVNQGPVGTPPTTTPIVDIAVRIDRTAPAVTGTIAWALQNTALPTAPAFVTFDTNNPTFIRSLRTITGITEPTISGFDTRPATGELFAMGYNPTTEAARLYTINLSTGAATAVGAGPITLTGAGTSPIGFDFNPVVDRIRVVATTGKNFRLNPNTGALAATDLDLAYAVGDPNFGTSTNIGTAAYTNSFAGATTTTLYTIDEQLTQLNTQIPPNNGTQNTVGPLGLTLTPADRSVDLDILTPPAGSPTTAFLTANVNNANPVTATFDNLYTVNLATGTASLVGRIGGGIAIRDVALRLATATFWTGLVSIDWNTSGNWSTNVVPTNTTNVVIPSAPVNQPTLTGNGSANLLIINAGATLTLAPTASLSLSNNLTTTGTFAGNATSNTLLNKAGIQVLGGTGSTTFGFVQVAIGSSGASLEAGSAGIQVLRRLILNGNLVTNGRPMTLVSDAAGTAMVVNGGGVVVGNATVQRYITTTAPGTPGVGYRHLSAPVATTVGDLTTAGFTAVVNPAYNTSPTPGLVVPYPNVFGFNEARLPANPNFGSGYFSPTALTDPMVQGRGYSVYMPGTATPDFVGTLGTGNIVVSNLTKTGATSKSGWHLLGNPYPAPIDWDLVTVPVGMSPTVYVFRTSGGLNGTYATRTNGVGPAGTDLIGMGQGFFAQVTGAGPVAFTFTDAARLTNYANPAVYRAAADPRPLAHLTLRRADQPTDQEADAAFVYFQDGASAAVERTFDGAKLRAEGETASIFTLAGGQELAINGLGAAAVEAATVPLGIVLPVAGTYELSVAELRAFAPGTAITLVDRRTNTTYDLTKQDVVRFTATQTGADLTRFSLRFGRGSDVSAASTLSLDVYPNPVSRTAGLNVTALGIGQGTTAEVALYDALGRAVLRQTVAVMGEAASAVLKTSGLRPGAYTLRLTTATGTPLTRQVVVE